jgi:tetratricopeptide (TPR) repeat protein
VGIIIKVQKITITLEEVEKDFEKIPGNIKKLFIERKHDLYLVECEKHIKSNPESKSIYIFKGIILEEKERYKEALKCLNIALENYPDFYILYKNKGHCYIYLKRYALARDSYREFLSFNNKDAEAWCYMSLCFYLLGKKDVALGLLDHALGETENKSIVSLLKGMLYENEEMDDDALISYVESQMLSKNDEGKKLAGEKIFNMFN